VSRHTAVRYRGEDWTDAAHKHTGEINRSYGINAGVEAEYDLAADRWRWIWATDWDDFGSADTMAEAKAAASACAKRRYRDLDPFAERREPIAADLK